MANDKDTKREIINLDDNYFKKINAPRPHYLLGEAIYIRDENRKHIVEAKAYFPSTEKSISDRIEKHGIPHVNLANAMFGVWNAAAIIAFETSVENLLAKEGRFNSHRLIPGDKEIDLTLIVEGVRNIRLSNNFNIGFDFSATYLSDRMRLFEISGKGVGYSRNTNELIYTKK